MIRRLYHIYARFSGSKCLIASLLLLQHAATIAVPFLFGALIARLSETPTNFSAIPFYALLLFGADSLSLAADYAVRRRTAKETAHMGNKLKKEFLGRFLKLNSIVRDRTPSGEWGRRINGDSQMLAQCSCPVFSELFGGMVIFLISGVILLRYEPLLILFLLLLGGLFYTVHVLNRQQISDNAANVRKNNYRESSTLLDILSLMPVMRLFRVTPFLENRFGEATTASCQAATVSAYAEVNYSTQIRFVIWLSGVIVLAFSLLMFHLKMMNIADVVAYGMLINQLTGQMGKLIFLTPSLIQGAETAREAEQVFGCLTRRTEQQLSSVSQTSATILPEGVLMELRHVSFRYSESGREILHRLCWQVPCKQYISILGRNGEGKSTLIKLMLGELEVTEGHCSRISHTPGYVPQKTSVFCGTLEENITLCNQAIPREKVLNIIQRTRLTGLMQQVGGLDTPLLQEQLSGGEIQRIGIARALVLDPDLLVVDEITNNLDIANKALIFRILKELKSTCTIISISHDIEALADSDQCLMLLGGALHPLQGSTPEERREFAFQQMNERYSAQEIRI